MPECRSCNAQIKWIKTTRGKNMPCDPELINYEDALPGTVLITITGKCFTVDKDINFPNVRGYQSHFATCVNADEHRKPK